MERRKTRNNIRRRRALSERKPTAIQSHPAKPRTYLLAASGHAFHPLFPVFKGHNVTTRASMDRNPILETSHASLCYLWKNHISPNVYGPCHLVTYSGAVLGVTTAELRLGTPPPPERARSGLPTSGSLLRGRGEKRPLRETS